MPQDLFSSNRLTNPASMLGQRRSPASPEELEFSLCDHEELVRLNASLEKAVDERTTRLREVISELEQVSYALVHDMRAPLRAMQGFARILAEETAELSLAQQKDYLGRIITASTRLDKLIEDSLTYNRTVLRILPLQAVVLSRLLRGLIETYPAFQPNKADIRIEGALPVVLGNEALLTQCFANLLDNAVKFADPQRRPEVRIRAECTSDAARIWVEDNGIGIPLHAQKRLFALFQKVNPDHEGTGLGLAIVRKVVERMNGKFGVESEPGKGSRFWVEFKKAEAD
jgi:signal transduction histidine kinase